MKYNVEVTAYFEKQLKRLLKKYPSLKKEYAELALSLKENPVQGNALGNDCYKVRLAIASKNKGKSGGARVIAHVKVVEGSVYLLSIYDKSEQENISDGVILGLLKLL